MPHRSLFSSFPFVNILDAVNGESGLGGAAIAGITSGIILSALAVTAEIVFFKFFSSAASANGFDPSVRYQV